MFGEVQPFWVRSTIAHLALPDSLLISRPEIIWEDLEKFWQLQSLHIDPALFWSIIIIS